MVGIIAGLGLALKITHTAYVRAVTALEVEKSAHAVTKVSFESYRTKAGEQMVKLRDSVSHVGKKYQEARTESEKLSKMLAKHDFTHLTERKPVTIERLVNRATAVKLREIEDLTTSFSRGEPEATGQTP